MPRLTTEEEQQKPPAKPQGEPTQDAYSDDYSESDEYDESDGANSADGYQVRFGQQSYAEWEEGIDPDSNMRHGFSEAYSSEEFLQALEKNYFLYWTDTRHERVGLSKPPSSDPTTRSTGGIGIESEPPLPSSSFVSELVRPTRHKAMERIGKNLQQQFENLAATPRTRYKQYLDPPIEDAKKFCTAARKTGKNERTLFYYNGHGVPKPTPSGELWLFNRQYTQYIPVSLADLISWIGSPAIYVWDCSAAGNIVEKVKEFSAKRDQDLEREAATAQATGAVGPDGQPTESKPSIPNVPFRDTIQLGACLGYEQLPMNPDLPADLFTCCLTSPIEIALRFFLLRNPLKTNLDVDMLLKISGKLNDRRTPLGELTWIFTAVTDTIAWNTLPRELFQKLFRHDLVVAALFRGFLLAERIMRFYECTPISVPALPQTHNHPLWDSWDLAVDMCLTQLPTLLEHEQRWLDSLPPQPPLPDQSPPPLPPPPPSAYVHSTFFAEQLTAFEIWLEQGTVAKRRPPSHGERTDPAQSRMSRTHRRSDPERLMPRSFGLVRLSSMRRFLRNRYKGAKSDSRIHSAAVVGGNVCTSQRITDVVLKAFNAAAASQGCCNNLTFGMGGKDKNGDAIPGFGYYETIAGGTGAGHSWHGTTCHSAMTNTKITDPEILERRYPTILHQFTLREGSGGEGKYRGGDGIIREIEFTEPVQCSILSERRVFHPYGLEGGGDGQTGRNIWVKKLRAEDGDLPPDVKEEDAQPRKVYLGGKATVKMGKGDRIVIETPGGGGWGKKPTTEEGEEVGDGEGASESATGAFKGLMGSLADRAAHQLGV
ncbi:uncharacterized protein JCM6883_000481 [Sporobolomyces salmoneus]|uniref:uncharacterized protein n=1 Tax=Sporobolomyces salmoneus TaxID=183962 RepID=UPI003171C7F9